MFVSLSASSKLEPGCPDDIQVTIVPASMSTGSSKGHHHHHLLLLMLLLQRFPIRRQRLVETERLNEMPAQKSHHPARRSLDEMLKAHAAILYGTGRAFGDGYGTSLSTVSRDPSGAS
uniref:Uncharacterized protein n=1 Tax=Anopheles maculatus TaxID=74869 RepID=A0A182TC08_9DIPT